MDQFAGQTTATTQSVPSTRVAQRVRLCALSRGDWELASLPREFPLNHGHVVWHPALSRQDVPPTSIKQSTQVAFVVLGPVQSGLLRKQFGLVSGCGTGVGRGRGVGIPRGDMVAVAVAVAVA